VGESEKKKKRRRKERKIPSQRVGESKKEEEEKIPDQGSKENRRSMQKGLWTRKYLNNTELSPRKQKKKGNHNLKWSSPFDCQPKSCALMTCSPRAKQKQKRKRPKTHKSQKSHQRNPFPREVLLIHDHACNL